MPKYIDYEAWNRIKKNISKSVLQSMYPVGSIYTSVNATNPKDIFGGEWQEFGQGRTLVGFDSSQSEFNQIQKEGGEKTHTLSQNEMPSHTHTQNAHNHTGSSGSAGSHNHTGSSGSAGSHNHSGTANSAGNHRHGLPYKGNEGNDLTGTRYAYPQVDTANGTHNSDYAGTHTHSLTIDSNGSHNHTISINSGGNHSHTVSIGDTTATNQNTGGNQSHNNLQPYIVVYFWLRIA